MDGQLTQLASIPCNSQRSTLNIGRVNHATLLACYRTRTPPSSLRKKEEGNNFGPQKNSTHSSWLNGRQAWKLLIPFPWRWNKCIQPASQAGPAHPQFSFLTTDETSSTNRPFIWWRNVSQRHHGSLFSFFFLFFCPPLQKCWRVPFVLLCLRQQAKNKK
jgi:hypothetical protein